MEKADTKSAKKKSLSDKEQHRRFVETARDLNADESIEKFERDFSKLVPPKTTERADF